MTVDPLKARRLAVQLPERRMRKVKSVQRPDIIAKGSGILACGQKLFPRMGHEPAIGCTEAGFLLLLRVSRDPGRQGRLSAGHSRMGQRKDVVLAVLIQQGIGKVSVMLRPVLRPHREIIQETLGPPEVPAVIESEPVVTDIARGHRPLRGTIRDQDHVGEGFPERLRKLPHEIHAFKVLPAAVYIVMSVSEIQDG